MEKNKNFELDSKGEIKGEVDLNETIRAVLDATLKKERLYFDLLAKSSETAEAIKTVSSNMMKMSMDDQIQLLKASLLVGQVSKKLAEKYDFDELCEEDEDE